MNKKGTELSLNVIIIAAIGVLILVILAFLVIKASTDVQGGKDKCNAQGGLCVNQGSCQGTLITNAPDCAIGKECCKAFG